jgi:hypothetical protein
MRRFSDTLWLGQLSSIVRILVPMRVADADIPAHRRRCDESGIATRRFT